MSCKFWPPAKFLPLQQHFLQSTCDNSAASMIDFPAPNNISSTFFCNARAALFDLLLYLTSWCKVKYLIIMVVVVFVVDVVVQTVISCVCTEGHSIIDRYNASWRVIVLQFVGLCSLPFPAEKSETPIASHFLEMLDAVFQFLWNSPDKKIN